MKAVFKHEISSYYTSLSGYVFGLFLLLFAGIYVMIYNVRNLLTRYEAVIFSISFVFLIIVPIITMRIFAEEKKQRTDQLLYSLPISIRDIVLGKFLALLVVFLAPLAIMCVYPLILSAFGNIHMAEAYSAVFAFFLLGMALLSIGMFISSICESQAVAAGLCFVVMLINYFIATLASYTGVSAMGSFIGLTIFVVLFAFIIRFMTGSIFTAITGGLVIEAILAAVYMMNQELFIALMPRLMEKVSLFERFNVFINGIFDISGVFYLLSVTAIFVHLTIQSLEKRRWS